MVVFENSFQINIASRYARWPHKIRHLVSRNNASALKFLA